MSYLCLISKEKWFHFLLEYSLNVFNCNSHVNFASFFKANHRNANRNAFLAKSTSVSIKTLSSQKKLTPALPCNIARKHASSDTNQIVSKNVVLLLTNRGWLSHWNSWFWGFVLYTSKHVLVCLDSKRVKFVMNLVNFSEAMLKPILHQLATKRVVLASGSPRRQELIQNIVSCF